MNTLTIITDPDRLVSARVSYERGIARFYCTCFIVDEVSISIYLPKVNMYTEYMDPLTVDLAVLENALRSLIRTMKRPGYWSQITTLAGVTIDRPAGAIIHLLLASPAQQYHLQDLANALAIEAPSATRKTQELEKAGYLERATDTHDRRAVSFSLTPAGARLGKKVQAAQRQYLSQAIADWPAVDRQQFARLFELFSADMARGDDYKHQQRR